MADPDQPGRKPEPARLTVKEIVTLLSAVGALLLAVAVLISAVTGHPVEAR
jgi:hypothetical protein